MALTDDSSGEDQDPQASQKKRGPREFGPVVSLLFIPVLFFAAAISVMASPVILFVRRRQERNFATRMSAAGRSMSWKDFEMAIGQKQGTIIGECLSEKGPCRLWWTSEDVRAASPHKCYPDGSSRILYFGPFVDPDFAPFFEWCYTSFTSPHSGTGRLVSVPKKKHRRLEDMLEQLIEATPGLPFVATYSPTRIRGSVQASSVRS